VRVRLRGWISYFNLQADEQIELLPGLIIPEFSCSNTRSILKQFNMLVIACIGSRTSSPCRRAGRGLRALSY
jgi:hypothetical protein